MNEAVMERIEKEEDDRQWQKLHEKAGRPAKQEPTAQQRSYLSFLAKKAGMELDVSKIVDRAQASRLIDNLRKLRKGANSHAQLDARDRRIAFGMATKLVYRKYVDLHHNPGTKRFWNEVHKLFADYEEQQHKALNGVHASPL